MRRRLRERGGIWRGVFNECSTMSKIRQYCSRRNRLRAAVQSLQLDYPKHGPIGYHLETCPRRSPLPYLDARFLRLRIQSTFQLRMAVKKYLIGRRPVYDLRRPIPRDLAHLPRGYQPRIPFYPTFPASPIARRLRCQEIASAIPIPRTHARNNVRTHRPRHAAGDA